MSWFRIHRHVIGQKDIRRSAKLRIEFELKRSEVVNIIAVIGFAYGRVGEELSQTRIYRVVRHAIFWDGISEIRQGRVPMRFTWVTEGEPSAESRQWAEEQITRFWPQTEEDS